MTEDDVRKWIADHEFSGSPAEMRAGFARLADLPSVAGADVDESEAEVAGLRTRTFRAGDGPTVVHFHGGGYVFGSPDTHANLARTYARALGGTVVLPAVPLAPERAWPAQKEVRGVVEAVSRDLGGPVVLSGDSAGGHLAVVTGLELAHALRPGWWRG